MNRNSIKSFAIWARKKLIAEISRKAELLGITDGEIEEVAGAWFIRLIVTRFMEVNDYLPCNAFLSQLFAGTDDYADLLMNMNDSLGDPDGVAYRLAHDIPEDDFNLEKGGRVEIIGWLYQYYNTEPKDEIFALLKKNVKITKERLPAATQLFTPEWITRYMVENSLGRLWVEGCPNEELKARWTYYLEDAEQEPKARAQLLEISGEMKTIDPREIKVIDPCMGSGHILVYAFDVLMQIYESRGYSQGDAAKSILEHNLYGLDIDNRVCRLACFAVMMKARQYNDQILNGGTVCRMYAIEESNEINRGHLEDFGLDMSEPEKLTARTQMEYLLDVMRDAREYGSILRVEPLDWELLRRFMDTTHLNGHMTMKPVGLEDTRMRLHRLVEIGAVLAGKYDVVVTNPPYMGISGMGAKLSEFVKRHYPDSKSDLFAVFIERCAEMTRKNGFQAMITQHSWMFLSSYEKLREKLFGRALVNLAHLGARAFEGIGGEVVQTASFVLRNSSFKTYSGVYARLLDYGSQWQKESAFLERREFYTARQQSFSKIPGMPVAYWLKDSITQLYEGCNLLDISKPCKGIDTGDNNTFLRLWHEVENGKRYVPRGIPVGSDDFTKKWFPYNKGGEYRKWYGNNEYVVNWESNGEILRRFKGSNLRNKPYYFQRGITWSTVTSGGLSLRYFDYGFLFDNGGCCLFADKNLMYILALLNSGVAQFLLKLSPTLNYQPGDIGKIPALIDYSRAERVEELAESNIAIAREDWDSAETSWDFLRHPFLSVSSGEGRIAYVYEEWKKLKGERLHRLKANEEEMNRIFIEIYGLQDELTPDVACEDISLRPAELGADIRSFVSYVVGCMLGRYSLDTEGLVYGGGEWNDSHYSSFIPVTDNIIPITYEEYGQDDIVSLFCEFLGVAFGMDSLEENLDFITHALGYKGHTSRQAIRGYFLKDFYRDHCRLYQKRPIYWLFDSGKEDGFKALIYMHRYNADTLSSLRVDYLHRIRRMYEGEMSRMREVIESCGNVRVAASATKRREKLARQLKETKEYEGKLAQLALSRITLDPDDGVKANYEKLQTGADGEKLDVLAKI